MPSDQGSEVAVERAPLQTSCQSCRLRKIRCRPPPDGEGDQSATCQACRKKGINCIFVERSRTRNRSGKNVDAARQRYGSIVPAAPRSTSSSSSASVSPLFGSGDDILMHHQLASSFGAKLFGIWLDIDRIRSSVPNVDLPVIDFWALFAKYNSVGQRLDRLSRVDEVSFSFYTVGLPDADADDDHTMQLLCRITYAFAAPLYLPDQLAGNTRRDIAHRLLQEAEMLADSLLIWRKVELEHVAPLILLSRAKSTSDPIANGYTPYLSAAVAQFRQLTRRSVANLEAENTAMRQLGWSLIAADIFGSAERREVPNMTREELAVLLSGCPPSLPTTSELCTAARFSAELSMSYILQAVHVAILIAHDTATYTSRDLFSLETTTALWLRLDDVYGWARNTLFAVASPEEDGHNLIRIYTHVLWVAGLAIEMSLIQHLSEMITQAATPNNRICGLQDTEHLSKLVAMCGHANQRLSRALCAFLRLPQEQPHLTPLYTFGMAPGVVCSVARVLDLASAFGSVSASDLTLFPLGARDKLMSIRHLSEQIRYLSRGYPSPKMAATLAALDVEEAALGGLTPAIMPDIAVPVGVPMLAPFASQSSSESTHNSHSTPDSILSSPWLSDAVLSEYNVVPPLSTSTDHESHSPAEGWRWEMV
ncbi:hypothetical protein JCM10908_007254 [Rhodotorula pacifica]|uniref:Zn(II)2Cys6 transcription factor domain-containing protein n=1 Tax=Rhodotorula pacifica TaxID=1495444 RepID=UPI00316B404D